MRIAFVNQPMDGLLPPHQNSIGIWTNKTAPLIARDHDVVAYGKRFWTQQEPTTVDDVRYEFVRPLAPNRIVMELRDRIMARRRRPALPSYASRLGYLDYAVQVGVRARRWSADVLHVHNFSQFVPTLVRTNPRAGIVLHMSCEWLNQLDAEVIDERLERVDAVLGCSEYITAKVRERFPHHAPRCATVHNGVDVTRFVPGSGPGKGHDAPLRLLFVGRVSPEKGIHDLIGAFVAIASEIPDVRLDIVGPMGALPKSFIIDVSDDPDVIALGRFYDGDDDYETRLRALVPHHLREQVVFHGGVAQDEVIEHYQRADVLVNPSYSESFGMSLVEANACGTPVVATRVGGMPDIVGEDREVGLLVDRGDVEGLAAAVLELLSDEGLRRRQAEAGRRRAVERYAWDAVAASALDVYETVVGDRS